MPNGAIPATTSHVVRSAPDAAGHVTVVRTQTAAGTTYYDAAGYPGRTLGLPPDSQHCQPLVSLPVARLGNGSLNRSNITALLPLNVVATDAGTLVEVQGTGEGATYTRATLDAMLDSALAGCERLTALQSTVLSEPYPGELPS